MDIRELQLQVVEWADSAFPNRAPSNAFNKLFEEIGEWIRNPRDGKEFADVLIMLLDLANMYGITDPGGDTVKKLEVNKLRKWVKTDTGVYQHE